jgi:DNA polymerase-3 subunit epsilon
VTLPSHKDFVAIDVETASADPATICQLGIARFQAGSLAGLETYLVQPRSRFEAENTALHGLHAALVSGAPAWDEVYAHTRPGLVGKTIVSHTLFDRKAIFKACCRGRSPMFSYTHWIDSHAAAREAWPGLRSYSLRELARHFGLAHRAHDAGEDARVAGQIYLLAMEETAKATG